MAIAFDAAASVGSNTGTPFTWSHTCTGSNLVLLVAVSLRGQTTVSSISYNGVALSKLDSDTTGTTGSDARSELWALVNPATGAHTVSVALSGSDRAAGVSVSLTGASQTGGAATFGTAAKANGTGTTPSVVATSAAGELVIDALGLYIAGANPTLTVDGSQTENAQDRSTNGGGSNVKGGSSREAGAASVTMSWSNADSRAWAIVAVGVKPVPAAQTVNPSFLASAEVVSAPSPAPGPVSVSPARLDSTVTFASPPAVVSPGVVTLSPASIGSTASFGVPTIVNGTIAAPARIGSTASVGVPTITVGAVTLHPALIASHATVGAVGVFDTSLIPGVGRLVASDAALGRLVASAASVGALVAAESARGSLVATHAPLAV